ncbi:MAG: hypothetical protein JWM95_1839 [Gemmatimonadetes bacterium]|nr:hypothetical protein [Gemmatimonadota bacterium]
MADRDERPMPMRRDSRSVSGEDLYVLACNARRDAGDLAFAHIVRLEREIDALRTDLEWRQTHASTRTKSWVSNRMLYFASVLTALVLAGAWLRFTESGKAARIGFAEGYAARYDGTRRPALEPRGITADMTRAEIDSLNAVYEGILARRHVAEEAARDARRTP